MAGRQRRKVVAGVVIALSLCGQAAALTVYDVIQLSGKKYSDDDIVALIQATDSVFELKAGDITQLMGLGVSEDVIQAMLKAVTVETGTHPVESPPKRPPGAQASHLKASLDDIVLLSQRGVSDKTLLLFLENREATFTLDAESIDKLILAGVSEDVIRYLLARAPVVHTSRPAVIYPVSTYVETYPRYYYTPRYYRTPYSTGYSDYPYYWFGYRSGGYRAHGGHRATHFGDHRNKDHGNQPHTGKGSRHHRKDDQSHGGMASRRSHRGGEQAHTGTSGSHRSRGDHSSRSGSHNNRGGHTSSVSAGRGNHSSKGHSGGHSRGGGH